MSGGPRDTNCRGRFIEPLPCKIKASAHQLVVAITFDISLQISEHQRRMVGITNPAKCARTFRRTLLPLKSRVSTALIVVWSRTDSRHFDTNSAIACTVHSGDVRPTRAFRKAIGQRCTLIGAYSRLKEMFLSSSAFWGENTSLESFTAM